MIPPFRRLAAALGVALCTAGCGFGGINTLPLPGTVGSGPGALIYHVELANVATLEPNSPVLSNDVVIGSIRRIGLKDRHAIVDIAIRPDAVVPANATAAVGQTSLLGSMHLQLGPPPGTAGSGRLPANATIGLDRSSTYPSTEQTLAALAAVVNGGGLGQIGDVIHGLNNAFTGRQGDIRQLLGRLDELVGALDDQRDGVLATLAELDRLATTLADQRGVLTAALQRIPPALEVLIREQPRLSTALDRLRTFSDTASRVVSSTRDDLVHNLANLEPTFRALADVGPDIDTALAYAPLFPLGQNLIDRGIRGDYMNLFVTIDLTRARLKRGLAAGTRWGDENAELVPAPGDPGYDEYYSRHPLQAGVGGTAQLPEPPPPPIVRGR